MAVNSIQLCVSLSFSATAEVFGELTFYRTDNAEMRNLYQDVPGQRMSNPVFPANGTALARVLALE